MRKEQELDSQIKAALEKECDGILASEDLWRRIDETVCGQQAEQKWRTSMKHISIKKLCVAAAAACLFVSGISVLAGNTDFFVSGGKMEPEYTDYRDMEKAQEKLGYEADSVERFENGYVFEGASVDCTTAYSEENGEMYSVPALDVRYRKDGKRIDLNVSETAQMDLSKEPDATRTCGDITLRYDEYTNKMVPEGYELTEEDKINEQRDDYHIVYLSVTENADAAAEGQTLSKEAKQGSYFVSEKGADISIAVKGASGNESWEDWAEGKEPCVRQMKIVSWEKDGKYYDLSGADLEMSADELFTMAEEILGVR